MGQGDLTEKILEDYNDVFADIMNVLVFNGEQRIKPASLRNAAVHSIYKADDRKVHEQERDVAKIWDDCNVELALYGIENQTKTEKMMPLRVLGYEGASYRSQYLNSKSRVIPVVTIVLYFGTAHWNYSKNLKDIMEIPEGLEGFVNDYKIHVYEVSWLTDEQVAMFKSDFKVVANFFVNKRKNREYVPDDETTIKHVDEVLKLLTVMTGDSRYEEILINKEGEVTNMCEVAERIENRGIKEGIARATFSSVEEGDFSVSRGAQKLGLSEDEFVRRMIEAGYRVPAKA